MREAKQKSESVNVEIIKDAVLAGLGANANNGSNAGLAYLNANNRVSIANANWGFRQYRSRKGNRKGLQSLPLGKKVINRGGVSK